MGQNELEGHAPRQRPPLVMVEVRQLTAAEARSHLSVLADILIDCVAGGASVHFMPPLSGATAESFFEKVIDEVEQGSRLLLAAFVDSSLVGTVQVQIAMPPNQPHRAEIAKLLVLRSARHQGIGALLMQQAEDAARHAGKTLLVLDTATGGSAERLYHRLGWTSVGVIPNFALLPDGTPCGTTIFWKKL